MKPRLLDKWLNGEISPSELEVLKQDPVFAEYQKIDLFVKQLETPEQGNIKGLHELKTKMQASRKAKVVRLHPIFKLVAAAAIILFVGYFYLNSLPENYTTNLAETAIIELPDQSRVTLNQSSTLEFDDSNWDTNRSLELKGEAYFEVAKGKQFDVQTKNGTVSVLGTKFNVLSTNLSFEVVCYEGRVAVFKGEQELELLKGDKVFLKNGKLLVDNKFTSHPNWLHKESSFDNVSIDKVLVELASIYDININSENIDVDLRYSGSFTNEDLDTALQTITFPLELNFTIENKNVTIFAKE